MDKWKEKKKIHEGTEPILKTHYNTHTSRLTGLTKSAAFCFRPGRALTSRQVHKSQLANSDECLVLEKVNRFKNKKIKSVTAI